MSYCPLISYHREGWQKVNCMGRDCALADGNGECSIKQALECYIDNARQKKDEQVAFQTYWQGKPAGTRSADFEPPRSDGSYISF